MTFSSIEIDARIRDRSGICCMFGTTIPVSTYLVDEMLSRYGLLLGQPHYMEHGSPAEYV